MGMRFLAAALFAAGLAACSPRAEPDLNPLAETYVRMALEIGTHEEGFIDAYYGQPEWKTEAEANPRSIEELKAAADALRAQIDAAEEEARDETVQRRARTLSAYVQSARFRMDMMEGTRVPFVEEAERLFALRPEMPSVESFEPALARIEAALPPGGGTLAERLSAFSARFRIPEGRAQAVMDAAIAECRRRTAEHIALPENERFEMEFVSDQPWGAYNWYQGDNHSLIQVNTDQPLTMGSAIGYGCHEGYPGHHVQGIYAERLYRERGWVEYSILPLYTPQGPLNEGGGNYGVELAFPSDERLQFERETLFPLAGLDPSTAAAYRAVQDAQSDLAGLTRVLAAQYLDGDIDREQYIAIRERFGTSRAGAEQALRFAEHYRSYVINYSSGEDVIRAYVERAGDTPEARWAAYERILSEPTLPNDLMQ
jgi:hypothetical protein